MDTDKVTWEEIKKRGSEHYQGTQTQFIDLIKDNGMLRDFALACIIKYACRNGIQARPAISVSDMEKIKHYADMLIAITKE